MSTKTRLIMRSMGCVFLLFILINVLAFCHARAMTKFVSAGARTPKPEALTLIQKLTAITLGVTVPKPRNLEDPGSFGLSFEVVSYPSTRGNILEAWRIPSGGSSKTVIFFHGYAASKQSLLPVAVQFFKRGFSCFLVDFYGSGDSSGASTSIGFHEAEDVIVSYKYVRSKWPSDQVIVYSASMGSAAVLRASIDANFRPNTLLLESPFDSLLNTTRNRFSTMKIPSFGLAELLVFWGGVQQGFNGFKHNPSQYASYVSVPALLMYGETDPRVLPDQRTSIFENLRSPKKMILLEGAGHELLAESKLREWSREVFQFLDGVKD